MVGADTLHKIGMVSAPSWVGPPKNFLHRVVFLVKWQLRMGAEFRFCKVGPKQGHPNTLAFVIDWEGDFKRCDHFTIQTLTSNRTVN